MDLRVADPRVEYRTNPINVFTATPRFSWKIQSGRKNVLQTSYHIEVAEDSGFSLPIWDSGKVCSKESHLVAYNGDALKSSSRYYWRVKINDNHGEESPWSETAFFETTLLSNAEWQALFISAEDGNAGASSAGYIMRKEFAVSGKVKHAKLYASAKGIFIAYVNGQKASHNVLSPGWTEYNHRLLFETYDITPSIKSGANALGFMVGPGWYKGELFDKKNFYGAQTAIIAQVHLEYEDGSIEVIPSDATWKYDKAPVLYSELYHGEIYDARLEQEGWNCSGFNDDAWRAVNIESSNTEILKPHDGVPVKEQETFKPISMFKTPAGDTVIDFGQNIAGWVSFKVKARLGTK